MMVGMAAGMNGALEIARMSFLDALRNRLLYGVLVFVVLLLLASLAIAAVTMGRTELLLLDLGLGALSIIGNLMAIVIAVQSLQQEHAERTLYVLLTRLPSRGWYILGKFLGLAAVLGGLMVLMVMMLAAMVAVFGDIHWLSLAQALLATLFEIWIVLVFSLVFAQASSLFLAILLSFCMDIAGRFTSTIHQFSAQAEHAVLRWAGDAVYYLLPNLEAVNLRNGAGDIVSFGADRVLAVAAYGSIEIALLLAVSVWIFNRRNLS